MSRVVQQEAEGGTGRVFHRPDPGWYQRLGATSEFGSGGWKAAQTTVLMPLCLDLVLLVV